MAAPTQIPTQQPQHQKEALKKDEAVREEQERRFLEQEVREFDAYAFYDEIESWAKQPLPKPYKRLIHVGLFHVREVLWQPLPVSRQDEGKLVDLSKKTMKLLSLLRKLDQKGMECPYVHQMHKAVVETALEKCTKIKDASKRYLQARGLLARLNQLLNRGHLFGVLKNADAFSKRLEAIAVMCRHQEFTQDLIRLRRAATFRTGNILRDDDAVGVRVPKGPQKPLEKRPQPMPPLPRMPQGRMPQGRMPQGQRDAEFKLPPPKIPLSKNPPSDA